MRTFLKFAALAAGMILLLATIEWVRLGPKTSRLEWDDVDRLIWGTMIDQLVAGAAVASLLTRGPIQLGRSAGITLAVGLVGTALVGLATPAMAGPEWVELATAALALCLALGLVGTLAPMRRSKLLWLAMAALLGALLQVTFTVGRLVLLGLSM